MRELAHLDSDEDFWARWLSCQWVRDFESGRCSAEDFSSGVVSEWGLAVTAEQFLEAFRSFPEGLYEGALELVEEVRQRVKVGCLSNSNPPNWALMRQWGLDGVLDVAFLSHEIGHVKPDRAIFDYAVEALGVPAHRVVFIDDNRQNVEGARAAGMEAVQALGTAGARHALADLGVL
jgi:HAD superfamily hydrolase (TIGR01509 family)